MFQAAKRWPLFPGSHFVGSNAGRNTKWLPNFTPNKEEMDGNYKNFEKTMQKK
jgi:hypothetical protein